MPPNQQNNKMIILNGVFWLYNWFQAENNINIYFLMNGNIFNYSLASEQYSWNCGWFGCDSAYAIPPAPPGNISTQTREPIFAQSYINAYNTAFNQPNKNHKAALNNYNYFTYGEVNSKFVPGTFGYEERYNDNSNPSNSITINYLQDDASVYIGTPYYLFQQVLAEGQDLCT